jgi:hypothetical protein
MATTQTNNGAPTIDAAFEHVKELNGQWLTTARKAGHAYVDSYEKAVDRAIELELEVARLTQQESLKGLIEAQADVARELTGSYITAARSLMK